MRQLRFYIAAACAALFLVPAVWAQSDDAEERGSRIVVEIGEDGALLVDGEELSAEDGSVVLRVGPDGDGIEVEVIEPMGRHVVVRGRADGGPDHHVFRRSPDGDRLVFRKNGPHVRFEDFDLDFEMPHIPDVAPLMERVQFGFADPLRESLEEHREVAELERESREKAREARRAEGAERSELEAELRSRLNEIFDKKLEIREQRIENLQEKVAEERDRLERRREAREEMIERRLRTLMGEDDILDW